MESFMSDTHGLHEDVDGPGRYAIRIDGHLDARWSSRFEGLIITLTKMVRRFFPGLSPIRLHCTDISKSSAILACR